MLRRSSSCRSFLPIRLVVLQPEGCEATTDESRRYSYGSIGFTYLLFSWLSRGLDWASTREANTRFGKSYDRRFLSSWVIRIPYFPMSGGIRWVPTRRAS